MSLFYKLKADNVTPMTRTPWAGDLIRDIKIRSLPKSLYDFSSPIGESWEVSSDKSFESVVIESSLGDYKNIPLNSLIEREGQKLLGKRLCRAFGDKHYPLLLKWLHASSPLSVQVHPNDDFSLLGENECGKPESWLVVDAKTDSYIYIGFKTSVTRHDVEKALADKMIETLLYKYHPKPFDYIIVPEGCVHSIGSDVFVMEPQKLLEGKSGKTYRFYDWERTYNDEGKRDPNGKPRPLHLKESLEAIDWSLPFGEGIKEKYIFNLKDKKKFSRLDLSPFGVEIFSGKGTYSLKLPKEQACAFSLVYGKMQLEAKNKERMTALSGESLLISATQDTEVNLFLDSQNGETPFSALFYLNLG